MDNVAKIRNFTDLIVWQEGHKLVLLIYKITKSFPTDERFGLVSQLRRAAISVTSNIAEGFGRVSYREKNQFYSIALGSVCEIRNQIIIAHDIGYMTEEKLKLLDNRVLVVNKLLNGLIKSSRLHYS